MTSMTPGPEWDQFSPELEVLTEVSHLEKVALEGK